MTNDAETEEKVGHQLPASPHSAVELVRSGLPARRARWCGDWSGCKGMMGKGKMGGLLIAGRDWMLAGMIVDVLRFASSAGLPGLAAWLHRGYARWGPPPGSRERLARLLSQFPDDLEGVL